MKLWFENSWGEMRPIAECETYNDVMQAIDNFIDRCNENRAPDQHPFVRYYTRSWEDEETGMTKFDVGSWNEFFLWEGKVNYNAEC